MSTRKTKNKTKSVEQIKQSNINISDNEIIARILGGEKHLFELIMRRYSPRLFRIGRSFIKDEDEVEDIIQETYVKVYENLSKFEYRSSFSTWLIKILINISIARKAKMKRFEYADNDIDSHSEHFSIYNMKGADMKTPEENTINNELVKHLEKAIDSLPDKYRTVFMMREVEKMNVVETSACLNITESNVKVRLNRAKEMLRENLSEIYSDVEVFQFLGDRCDRISNKVMKRLNIY
ncbi:MAG: RNA polymerase sigma factor [Ignavibacteria bacterium]